ncbi:hypothetical protein A9R00_07880 [Oleispira antarctica]|uniref:Transposase n=1 Tax=Oleispira antarctica TaxID=188908 RepID=A0A1Y5HW33_OLEAN|nr:hypothetical protein A9R00_07880 [Oleispira antarctica]
MRKAFLCGFDASSQVSYEHRRAWLEDELLKQSAILQRLGIAPEHWLTLTQTFEESFNDLVGSPDSLTENLNLLNRKRRSNINNCKVLLS